MVEYDFMSISIKYSCNIDDLSLELYYFWF